MSIQAEHKDGFADPAGSTMFSASVLSTSKAFLGKTFLTSFDCAVALYGAFPRVTQLAHWYGQLSSRLQN